MDPREQLKSQIEESTRFIRGKTDLVPEIGLILGSGLGAVADEVAQPTTISYQNIPHFPLSMVPGHAGNLILGELAGKKVVVMQGRFHYFEGYTMRGITFPVRVLKNLGAPTLIVTNAAGGLNKSFKAGDLMVITDHINLMGGNPLVGPNDEQLGPRFVNMSEAYDQALINLAKESARKCGASLQSGVYAGATGPTYETFAEANFLSRIGADAVGMSTVPEVIVAAHAGLKVLGLSCITNVLHTKRQKTTHEEVLKVSTQACQKIKKLIKAIIESM